VEVERSCLTVVFGKRYGTGAREGVVSRETMSLYLA
jgi:hypothetical protein